MEYRPLKEYIELRQGLAINKDRTLTRTKVIVTAFAVEITIATWWVIPQNASLKERPIFLNMAVSSLSIIRYYPSVIQ